MEDNEYNSILTISTFTYFYYVSIRYLNTNDNVHSGPRIKNRNRLISTLETFSNIVYYPNTTIQKKKK